MQYIHLLKIIKSMINSLYPLHCLVVSMQNNHQLCIRNVRLERCNSVYGFNITLTVELKDKIDLILYVFKNTSKTVS